MTLYIISTALASGQLHLEDQVYISKNAWSQPGSRLFLKVGSSVSVDTLIKGIVIASGNDACVAIAEHLAGDEENFSHLMNEEARKLGMSQTHFVYSTGLSNPEHYTTARDLATLSRALIQDYPQYYAWYKQKWITYNKIRQPNRNLLLWRDSSVDGLKTGHTDAAGYCLIASALRNNMRLLAIVLHSPSEETRLQDTQTLLNWGYQHYKTYSVFSAKTPIISLPVLRGKTKLLPLGVKNTLYVTTPLNNYKELKATVDLSTEKIVAPVLINQTYGIVKLSLAGKVVSSAPLVALESSNKIAWFQRPWEYFTLIFRK
eukprot:TRINITY_DN43169_c0_g1_i1.p1 TRINITY_DN43169_c0_g1~~TRINITY_DN43169_c0_g1_i1.p1  ORF type:complete len:317 (+),score=-54.90 TRINITY_DN43169_c0_g1_i1:128-1078(+)